MRLHRFGRLRNRFSENGNGITGRSVCRFLTGGGVNSCARSFASLATLDDEESPVTTASLSRPWNLRGVSLMAFAHGASDLYCLLGVASELHGGLGKIADAVE